MRVEYVVGGFVETVLMTRDGIEVGCSVRWSDQVGEVLPRTFCRDMPGPSHSDVVATSAMLPGTVSAPVKARLATRMYRGASSTSYALVTDGTNTLSVTFTLDADALVRATFMGRLGLGVTLGGTGGSTWAYWFIDGGDTYFGLSFISYDDGTNVAGDYYPAYMQQGFLEDVFAAGTHTIDVRIKGSAANMAVAAGSTLVVTVFKR